MALNNRPGISERTRSIIWETAARLNYIPDQRARELRLGRQAEVALAVSPDLTSNVGTVSRLFALRLLTSLTDQLRAQGLRPLPLQISTDCSRSALALVIGDGQWFDQWQPILPEVPIVLAGGTHPDPRIVACLTHDHRAYVREVVTHLRRGGAGHIALLREAHDSNYQQAITDELLEQMPTTVITATIDPDGAQAAATRAVRAGADAILSLLPFPGAILQGIRATGARCPDDILVVVRAEGLIESQTVPAVTALSMCGQASAEFIMRTVNAVLSGDTVVENSLPHELLIRASSQREV